jgi:hypothetical protein
LAAVVRDASTTAFHLAMIIGAALLLAGAIVNAVGIVNNATRPKEADEDEREHVAATPA